MWPLRCRVTARGSRSRTEHGSTRLWVFPLDPVARRLGSGKPLTEDDAMASDSALSPDGQFVAYNLMRPGIDRDGAVDHEHRRRDERAGGDRRDCPTLVARRKGDCLQLFSTDRQPVTGRVAVRQLGGKERFLSRWSTNLFMPSDWSAERGLARYLRDRPSGDSSLALWPTTNPDADKPDRVLISKPKTGFWQAQFSPNGRWLSFVAIRNDRPGTLR